MDVLRLCTASLSKVKRMETHAWTTWAKVSHVYDGDTFTVGLVWKWRLVKWRCRIMHVDAPELRTKDEDERRRAIAARDFLAGVLPTRVFRMRVHGLDKYGRLLVDPSVRGKALSEHLMQGGHAVAYDGGTKKT